jgi:hypothetical protein
MTGSMTTPPSAIAQPHPSKTFFPKNLSTMPKGRPRKADSARLAEPIARRPAAGSSSRRQAEPATRAASVEEPETAPTR